MEIGKLYDFELKPKKLKGWTLVKETMNCYRIAKTIYGKLSVRFVSKHDITNITSTTKNRTDKGRIDEINVAIAQKKKELEKAKSQSYNLSKELNDLEILRTQMRREVFEEEDKL